MLREKFAAIVATIVVVGASLSATRPAHADAASALDTVKRCTIAYAGALEDSYARPHSEDKIRALAMALDKAQTPSDIAQCLLTTEQILKPEAFDAQWDGKAWEDGIEQLTEPSAIARKLISLEMHTAREALAGDWASQQPEWHEQLSHISDAP